MSLLVISTAAIPLKQDDEIPKDVPLKHEVSDVNRYMMVADADVNRNIMVADADNNKNMMVADVGRSLNGFKRRHAIKQKLRPIEAIRPRQRKIKERHSLGTSGLSYLNFKKWWL